VFCLLHYVKQLQHCFSAVNALCVMIWCSLPSVLYYIGHARKYYHITSKTI